MGLLSILALKVCHLVSKSLYNPKANLEVVKEPSFEQKLVFKFRFKKIYFEIDVIIVGDVIAKVF